MFLIFFWRILGIRTRVYRLTTLRLGNFFIWRAPGAGAGADPIVNNDPPDEVDGAKAMGELKGEDGCCGADWPNPPPVPNDDWGNVKFAPPAGEAG